MFTAASVMNSVWGCVGTSMMKTWLMRRPRAQSGLALGDLAQQLVGMEAALHEQLGLALAHERDGLLGRRLAVRHVDDLDAVDVEATGLRELSDLVRRAHEYGNDQSRPIGLERTAREVSSQGCATAVGSGALVLAASMSRSYLAC